MIHKTTAVILFTGEDWRASVFTSSISGLHLKEKSEIIDGSHKTIPRKILEWCKLHNAESVTIIEPANIVSIKLNLPDNLTNQERQTALKWEVAAHYGEAATNAVKLSATKVTCYGKGSEKDLLFTAIFRENKITEYKKTLEEYGLKLRGITSLQLSLLATICKDIQENDTMLFISRNKSFAYIADGVNAPSKVRNIPIGYPENSSNLQNWQRKLSTRVTIAMGGKLHTIIPNNAPPTLIQDIETAIPNTNIMNYKLSDVVDRSMLIVAQGLPDKTSDKAAICGTIQKEIKSKASKTKKLIIIIASITLLIVAYYMFLNYQIKQCQTDIDKRKAIKTKIDAINSKIVEIVKGNKEKAQLIKSLSNEKRVPQPFLKTLKVVCATIPQGCRINELSFINGTLKLQGVAKEQNGLALFEQKITEFSRATKISLATNINTINKNTIAFTYTLSHSHKGSKK